MAPSKPWRERIRHFTWAWHTVIMGTGVLSSLTHNFPYGNGSLGLRVLFLFFFMLNLVLFILIFGATVARYVMFPGVWTKMIRHPAQSLFMGAFPMGAATLVNAALVVNQEWHWGGTSFLWAIWGFYWLDSLISYCVAFGMLYHMMIRQEHSLAKMSALWLLPVVTLIVASSSGGNIAASMRNTHPMMALLTAAFSFTMVIIGLSLALMLITIYLLRVIAYGPPDVQLIFSAFVVLGPLGQGGYSLLASGQDLSFLLPAETGTMFPTIALTSQIIFGVCFCGAYILWSMGVCWAIVAFYTMANQLRTGGRIPFSVGYWGMIFPNGVFAMLSVQLAKVLDSPFFRVFGATWSVFTLCLWLFTMSLTIPAVIDGSVFKAPYLMDPGLPLPVSTILAAPGDNPDGSHVTLAPLPKKNDKLA